MNSIYEFPDIYDAVLQRPPEVLEAEVASIRRMMADRGVTAGRVLELACGTCPHGIRLARQGFSATGVDKSCQMLDAAKKQGVTVEQASAARMATVPAKRFGEADEFGAACAFLCSAHAGYITGQNLLIDGGVFPGAF